MITALVENYSIVEGFATLAGFIGRMAIFTKAPQVDQSRLHNAIDKYQYDPW